MRNSPSRPRWPQVPVLELLLLYFSPGWRPLQLTFSSIVVDDNGEDDKDDEDDEHDEHTGQQHPQKLSGGTTTPVWVC